MNISSDGQDYHVSILDKPIQGRITIEKTGEVLVGYENGKFIYDKLGLAGMKAEVIAYEDILDCADGRVLYKKGETVATVITDESGKVIVNVPLGKYKVKEVVAPQGYILSYQEYIVELTEDKVSDGIVTSSSCAELSDIIFSNVSFLKSLVTKRATPAASLLASALNTNANIAHNTIRALNKITNFISLSGTI